MSSFAFVGHFISKQHLAALTGWIGRGLQSKPALFSFLRQRLPPFTYVEIGPIKSATGASAAGWGLICPFLPEDFVSLPAKQVIHKVVDTLRLAERLGARIVGLGGFSSICCNEGEDLIGRANLAITSGNTYTAALAYQGVTRAAERLNMPLEEATLTVLGATGDIGSGVARILADQVAQITITGRNVSKLEEFAQELRLAGARRVVTVRHVREAVKSANMIVAATSALTTLIEAEDLNPGAIVCDVALPHNISREVRSIRHDVLVFDGGMANFPLPEKMLHDKRWEALFPQKTAIYGCLAETILLGLENRCENYSIGHGRITPDRIREMLALAAKHGFSVADFTCNNQIYRKDEFVQIASAIGK